MSEQFCVVVNEWQVANNRFTNAVLATERALRLITNNPDDTYYVLQAVRKIAPASPPARITDLSSGEEKVITSDQMENAKK